MLHRSENENDFALALQHSKRCRPILIGRQYQSRTSARRHQYQNLEKNFHRKKTRFDTDLSEDRCPKAGSSTSSGSRFAHVPHHHCRDTRSTHRHFFQMQIVSPAHGSLPSSVHALCPTTSPNKREVSATYTSTPRDLGVPAPSTS